MKTDATIGAAAGGTVLRALLLLALPAAAFAGPPASAARVDVYPGYYAAEGKRFADLGQLEGWVNAKGAKSLVFHACMGSANARLAAAIERFNGAYVDVRWIDAGKSGCPAAAADRRS